MVWFMAWKSIFGLSYSTKFHSSGMYVPSPIMTKTLGGGGRKLLEILWNFPNLVTPSGSPSIPISKVTLSTFLERLVVLLISGCSRQQACFPLFLWKGYLAPFALIYFAACGTPGCLEARGKPPQIWGSLSVTAYLGQYISLGLTQNNNSHFFFNACLTCWGFFSMA